MGHHPFRAGVLSVALLALLAGSGSVHAQRSDFPSFKSESDPQPRRPASPLPSETTANGWDNGFFFIHIRDAHVWDRPEEVIGFLELERPWWIPRAVYGWFAMRIVASHLPVDETAIASSLRAALKQHGSDVDDLWDSELLPVYIEEVMRPGSPFGDGESRVRSAFAEVSAFGPAFVVNTGDIVLDSGSVPLEVSDRWMRLYREVSESGGFPVYNTIGNHGLGGIARGASPDDPEYGPGFFHNRLGPSYYSFDRGRIHFIALDTHHPPPNPGHENEDHWAINRMRPEVASWLDADLEQSADRVRVVMNHEPFRAEPTWPFPESYVDTEVVPDQVIARSGVAYALTGHAHLPAVGEQNGVTSLHAGSLSGIFWLMPPDLQRGGYRLIYAREGRLHSGWKELEKPLLAFAEPPAPDGQLVVVAADKEGPLAGLRVELDGVALSHEVWGDYFLSVNISPGDIHRVTVYGKTSEGTTLRLLGR